MKMKHLKKKKRDPSDPLLGCIISKEGKNDVKHGYKQQKKAQHDTTQNNMDMVT